MANRIHPALQPEAAPSSRKARLVDFETGKSDLRPEHRIWLDETNRFLRLQQDFYVYIYGFASKLGQHGATSTEQSQVFNLQLSYDRASAIARYLEKGDGRVSSRIREFSARGNTAYTGAAGDNSPEQRAAEVHVHIAHVPPPPPPDVEPLPSLPGGPRYASWSVAAPGGVTATILPGAVVGANVVVFRCRERRNETHAYVSPGAGVGLSYSGPSLSKLKDLIKNILGNLSYSGMSFTDFTATTPFNFRDLDGANCELRQAGVGAGPGYLLAKVSVHGQVWYRERNGKPFFGMRDFCKNVDVSGKDLQLGIGGSVVGGPLIRVD